jgi:vacuolar-type H+-ATPase subunit F/Vma7
MAPTPTDRVAYLGDATQAAAFGLAGFATWAPQPGEEVDALAEALAQSDLVLLAAPLAHRLPTPLLDLALAGLHPLVMVVPALDASALHAGSADALRRQFAPLASPQPPPAASLAPTHAPPHEPAATLDLELDTPAAGTKA